MAVYTEDLVRQRMFGKYSGNPTPFLINSTGVKIGPLAAGTYQIEGSVDCFFKRGTSALATTDVLVDTATPLISHPLWGGYPGKIFKVIDATDAYICVKTPAGVPAGYGSIGLIGLDVD